MVIPIIVNKLIDITYDDLINKFGFIYDDNENYYIDTEEFNYETIYLTLSEEFYTFEDISNNVSLIKNNSGDIEFIYHKNLYTLEYCL